MKYDEINVELNSSLKNYFLFSDGFYYSKDRKTIMGEVPFRNILFLEYRDTNAGSNPREYNGLKNTNKEILKSLLNDYDNFKFLHSGIIVSAITPTFNENICQYEYCCLTNGNQTRFIILILTLLKIIYKNKPLKSFSRKEYNDFIKLNFESDSNTINVLPYLQLNKVNQIINFLNTDSKSLEKFSNFNLSDFLDAKIRIQINVIDNILSDLDDSINEFDLGTSIAEANNDTQKVKVDDIFGNRNKAKLSTHLFSHFIEKYQDEYEIEYRLGEISGNIKKVHILTLLRPVISTGLLCKEKDVYNLTNQVYPIYSLIERLLKKDPNREIFEIISQLIPILFEIRINYIRPKLEEYKRKLVMDYKEKALAGELDETIISKDIENVIKKDRELEKLIKKSVTYNIEHILPVLIFQIRNLFLWDKVNLTLNILKDKEKQVLETLTINIYEKYVKKKLRGVPLSLSTLVRKSDFYELGADTFLTLKNLLVLKESNFIYQNRVIV